MFVFLSKILSILSSELKTRDDMQTRDFFTCTSLFLVITLKTIGDNLIYFLQSLLYIQSLVLVSSAL